MSEELKTTLAACLFCGGEITLSPCLGQDRYDFNCDCPHTISIWAENENEAIETLSKRFVCPDKNGKPVYAGDEFNFLSDCDPPIKLHFVWSVPQLRYMYENERGDTWRPSSSDEIELIEGSESGK